MALVIPPTVLVSQTDSPPELAALQELLARRDFFALRDQLTESSDPAILEPRLGFFVAATQQAFNRPQASNDTLQRLLANPDLAGDEIVELRHLQLTNFLRLHRYKEALDVARAILSVPGTGAAASEIGVDTRSKLPLLEALKDVPPQQVSVRGPSRLALGETGRMPLEIQGTRFAFALDTGANLSVINRTEALKLGLEIRPANLLIATSTARKITGDVAVADEVEIGKVGFRNVVFLVLPDELLSFPDGTRIPGLVGFPLIDAMGEVRFRQDNVLEIPRQPPRRSQQNMALDGLEPLVQIRYGKQDLLCRLDTGARRTVFYEPFFRRFQKRVESSGHSITAKAAGVGGMQEIPAFRLPKIALTVASAGVTLRRVEVYTQAIRPPGENYLDCNLGLDAFARFRSYTLSFREMAMVLD